MLEVSSSSTKRKGNCIDSSLVTIAIDGRNSRTPLLGRASGLWISELEAASRIAHICLISRYLSYRGRA